MQPAYAIIKINMASKKNKQRTYARNRIVSRRGYMKSDETDGQYLLKLVIVVILGSFWIKFGGTGTPGGFWLLGLPIGAMVGLLLIHKLEKSQYNRKIWYAILIVVTIVSSILPSGIMI